MPFYALVFLLSTPTPKYASEDAELLLVGNKLDCEVDREISRQQGEKVGEGETKLTHIDENRKLLLWKCERCRTLTLHTF